MKNPKGAGRKPKLTELEILSVLSDLKSGMSKESVAVKYGVSMSTVVRIFSRV